MSEIVVEPINGICVLINDDVINTIESYRQVENSQTESGGILIGEYRGEHLNIVGLTTPSVGDVKFRFRFFRRSKTHQSEALKAWNSSDKKKTFIGDWHTHAEDHPSPSSIDTTDWLKKLPKRKMFLIIQGRKSRWYGVWDGANLLRANLSGE